MRITRLALLVLAAALAAAAPAPSARAGGDPPPANPLRGADVPALLAKAAEMKAKDARDLGKHLAALGDPFPQRGADHEFLVEYSLRETSRALRLLAVEAAQRIDPAGTGAAYLKKTQGERDTVRVALALEGVAATGGKAEVPALLEFLKNPSSLVAAAAADALARLGAAKDMDEIADLGLVHADSHVTDHAAWAVQDIAKTPKTAAAMFRKIASKKNDPRAIRAEATVALLEDKMAEAQKWAPSFEASRKLLFAAPATVPVKGVPELVPRVEAMLTWMRERLPAEHWLFCASVKGVNAGPKAETRPDFEAMTIDVAPADAALTANKMAYLVFRQGVVMFRRRIGEPYMGHRGWEPGIFDSYDLCVAGKLYDAGPGGLSREKFVAQILSGRPWGGL